MSGDDKKSKKRGSKSPKKEKMLYQIKLQQIRLKRLNQDNLDAKYRSQNKSNDKKFKQSKFHLHKGMFLADYMSLPPKKKLNQTSLPTNKAFRLRQQVNANLVKSISAQELNLKGFKNWESSTKIATTHARSGERSPTLLSLNSKLKSPERKLYPYTQHVVSRANHKAPTTIEYHLQPFHKTETNFGVNKP